MLFAEADDTVFDELAASGVLAPRIPLDGRPKRRGSRPWSCPKARWSGRGCARWRSSPAAACCGHRAVDALPAHRGTLRRSAACDRRCVVLEGAREAIIGRPGRVRMPSPRLACSALSCRRHMAAFRDLRLRHRRDSVRDRAARHCAGRRRPGSRTLQLSEHSPGDGRSQLADHHHARRDDPLRHGCCKHRAPPR
jgi:hypothetical protein